MKSTCRAFFCLGVSLCLASSTAFAGNTDGLDASTQESDAQSREFLKMAESLLKTYKSQLRDAGLDDLEAALDKSDATQPRAPKPIASSEKAQPGQLRTGTIQSGHLESASLPLTLPSAAPTTEPVSQYETWRLAGRVKAIRDRYLELRQIARGN